MMMGKIPGLPAVASDQIISSIRSCPSVQGAILFGSRAKGNYREGSDIDIALQGAAVTLDEKDALQLKYELLYLPWKLDLVIYGQIDEPALREHIDRVGQRLF